MDHEIKYFQLHTHTHTRNQEIRSKSELQHLLKDQRELSLGLLSCLMRIHRSRALAVSSTQALA